MICRPLPQDDLAFIAKHDPNLWTRLANANIFMTGATGFYGAWFLESFCAVQDMYGLNAKMCILTRNPETFRGRFPHLARRPDIECIQGDICSFEAPSGNFEYIVHAATPASATMNIEAPLEMFTTIVDGTKRVLEFAKSCGAKRFLLASSGAIYGVQPSSIENMSESFQIGPDTMGISSAYGEGKRAAECLSAIYGRTYGFESVVARGYAFVGPHLPLDGTFAIGNFIRDGISKSTIVVGGDGTPYRSYLYAADLALWLWTILIRGKAFVAYNLGSDEGMTIREVAKSVASICGTDFKVMKSPNPDSVPHRYVPDITLARSELGLSVFTDFKSAVEKTIAWVSRT